ncbi:YncE family protein [Altererythrobacter ishigakiensis]|uniref:Sugar lactone lactonase YvrE n=1 Tax=Altererythrobacter ishigakiensis TaxID=476157 RepID=A0A562UWZ4_9SPHN|nr:hypothetical protein [Altererythrobacter ishigakiensis]TWJ10139.1 hypothetical protein JN10_1798 [Altererythrobacter ishigakiensis]
MLRAFAAGFALVLASPAWAEEVPVWRAVDASTGQIRDVGGLEQLALDFPDSGTVRLRMLQPLLEADEVEKVMQTLEWLYDRGYVFSDVAKEQIPRLLEGVDPGRIAERLRADAEVIEVSEVVATVPAEAGLAEDVMPLANGEGVVVTSVSENALFGPGPGGNWIALTLPEANDLSGFATGTGQNVGWVASGNIDGSSDDKELFSGLIGLTGDLDTTIYIRAPNGATVSDIHVANGGRLFASDPISGGVYTANADDDVLAPLLAPGTFRSPQGLATNADDTKLYVSDYRYAIAVIDLETREVSRLASDIPVILDGVDGLWRNGNELIAVQNGTSPMRISAFKLSKDGMRVIGHRILEQAHSEWTEPLSGSIDGDALIYIGNGQWDRYFEGELKPGMEALPTEIRRLPIARSAG